MARLLCLRILCCLRVRAYPEISRGPVVPQIFRQTMGKAGDFTEWGMDGLYRLGDREKECDVWEAFPSTPETGASRFSGGKRGDYGG